MNPEEKEEIEKLLIKSFIVLKVLSVISFIAFIIALLKT
jgi:hypothetical protein